MPEWHLAAKGVWLWLYTDEGGSPEVAALIAQAYLRRFRPDERLGFEWAFTCSKLRPDGIGGGAALITAEKVTYLNTEYWLDEQKEEWTKTTGD